MIKILMINNVYTIIEEKKAKHYEANVFFTKLDF